PGGRRRPAAGSVGGGPGRRAGPPRDGARLPPAERGGDGSPIGLRLLGGAPAPAVVAEDELRGRAHYYSGAEPSRWLRDVPTYRRVVYRGVYPGTDLVFHGSRGAVEFDFVVASGADPRAIALEVSGADTLSVDSGDVVSRAGRETLRLHAPLVYQESESGRVHVAGRFRVAGRRIAFEVSSYDATRSLVIDPVVSYSTYYGGSASEFGRSIGVDGAGNMYVVVNGSGGNRIVKLSADGHTLLYAVTLGDATPMALVADATGNAYVLSRCAYPRSGITFNCPTMNGLASGRPQAQGDAGA